jgi:DeoR/GlpR family transcriptional regulator of sugar metabolism
LVRTHGGATLAERFDPHLSLASREITNREAKRRIAAAAADLVRHGETLFLDAGSTCAILADMVADMELRVVTNSLAVMDRLADRSGIALFAVGGSYRHDAGSFIGPWAEETIRTVQLDHAFVGATGLSWEGRLSAQNSIEAQFKRSVIATARSTVALVDESKIGVQAFSVFAEAGDVAALCTDATGATAEHLSETGFHLLPAHKERV